MIKPSYTLKAMNTSLYVQCKLGGALTEAGYLTAMLDKPTNPTATAKKKHTPINNVHTHIPFNAPVQKNLRERVHKPKTRPSWYTGCQYYHRQHHSRQCQSKMANVLKPATYKEI